MYDTEKIFSVRNNENILTETTENFNKKQKEFIAFIDANQKHIDTHYETLTNDLIEFNNIKNKKTKCINTVQQNYVWVKDFALKLINHEKLFVDVLMLAWRTRGSELTLNNEKLIIDMGCQFKSDIDEFIIKLMGQLSLDFLSIHARIKFDYEYNFFYIADTPETDRIGIKRCDKLFKNHKIFHILRSMHL